MKIWTVLMEEHNHVFLYDTREAMEDAVNRLLPRDTRWKWLSPEIAIVRGRARRGYHVIAHVALQEVGSLSTRDTNSLQQSVTGDPKDADQLPGADGQHYGQ